jgi:two-component system, NarL family, invasion response regulator UvrY
VKILIVDIHPPLRELIRTVVQDLAHAVFECATDAEAATLYTAEHFDWRDLALMDLDMFGDDGVEGVRRLQHACPGARIIVVMQYDDAYLRAAAIEAGARGSVLKGNLLVLRDLLSGFDRSGGPPASA